MLQRIQAAKKKNQEFDDFMKELKAKRAADEEE